MEYSGKKFNPSMLPWKEVCRKENGKMKFAWGLAETYLTGCVA